MPAKKKNAKKRRKSNTAARKKTTAKKTAAKKTAAKKTGAKKTLSAARRPVRKKKRIPATTFSQEVPRARAVEQSGDLQGLSRRERADSESVEELIEEGNAFEANAVTGVEAAEDADEKEVRTHEVPEDDVPGEYL